jgi:glutathionylspermidine synthase-like protein
MLWMMFPGHPNLLPAYFDEDPEAARLGPSYVRKPLYSREGANVTLVVADKAIDSDSGPYGAEGYVRQAIAPLLRFDDNYAVSTTTMQWWAPGSRRACRAGCRSARTPARSRRTRRASCRMQSSVSAWSANPRRRAQRRMDMRHCMVAAFFPR